MEELQEHEKNDTGIKVKISTWKKLNQLKDPGQTFDDVIVMLLSKNVKQSLEDE